MYSTLSVITLSCSNYSKDTTVCRNLWPKKKNPKLWNSKRKRNKNTIIFKFSNINAKQRYKILKIKSHALLMQDSCKEWQSVFQISCTKVLWNHWNSLLFHKEFIKPQYLLVQYSKQRELFPTESTGWNFAKMAFTNAHSFLFWKGFPNLI